jgi:hypothetical protein
LGQHDVKMREKLRNEINQIYTNLHNLEQRIKAIEKKNAKPEV